MFIHIQVLKSDYAELSEANPPAAADYGEVSSRRKSDIYAVLFRGCTIGRSYTVPSMRNRPAARNPLKIGQVNLSNVNSRHNYARFNFAH